MPQLQAANPNEGSALKTQHLLLGSSETEKADGGKRPGSGSTKAAERTVSFDRAATQRNIAQAFPE